MEVLDVVKLVRLELLIARRLHFQHGPCVAEQDQEIGDTLSLTRILEHDVASRKAFLDLPDELALVLRLGHRLRAVSGYGVLALL